MGFCFKTNYPWGINIALVALQFFWLGNILRGVMGWGISDSKSTNYKFLLGFISAIILSVYVFLSVTLNNVVNMGANLFGNIGSFELLSLLGILSLVFFFYFIFDIRIGFLSWLGQNTLIIYAFHQPILRIVRFAGVKLLHSFPVESNIVYALIADLVVVLCLIPIVWFYNKYLSRFLDIFYLKQNR